MKGESADSVFGPQSADGDHYSALEFELRPPIAALSGRKILIDLGARAFVNGAELAGHPLRPKYEAHLGGDPAARCAAHQKEIAMIHGVRASVLALGVAAFASLFPLAASAATNVHHPAAAAHARTAHVTGRLTAHHAVRHYAHGRAHGYAYGYNPGAAAAAGVIGGILGAASAYPYSCDDYYGGYGSCDYGDYGYYAPYYGGYGYGYNPGFYGGHFNRGFHGGIGGNFGHTGGFAGGNFGHMGAIGGGHFGGFGGGHMGGFGGGHFGGFGGGHIGGFGGGHMGGGAHFR